MTEATTITLTVDEVKQATSKAGKAYWRVKAGGQTYYCWDATVAEALRPGHTYTCTVNGSAEYPKLLSAEPVQQAQPQASSQPMYDKERLMLRMSCLRAAAEVFAGTGQSAQVVLAMAEELEAWALR